MSAPMYAVLVNHCRQGLVCQREIFAVIADGLGNLQMLLQASLASGQIPQVQYSLCACHTMKKPSRSDSSLMTPEAKRTSCFELKKVTVYLFTDT